MDEPEIVPNWLGSTVFSRAGFTYSNTTKSSAILEREAVSDIGLSSFLGIATCFTLGRGAMSALFQTEGSLFSWYEALRIFVTGSYSRSAYSLRHQLAKPSGPAALCLFRCIKFL